MKDETKLKEHVDIFIDEMKRCSNGGAKAGAFLIGVCVIDTMASFYKARLLGNHKKDMRQFRAFMHKYMSRYSTRNGFTTEYFYKYVRCGLVHKLSLSDKVSSGSNNFVTGKFLLTDNRPDDHFKKRNGRVVLNLENFMADIELARDKFFSDDVYHNNILWKAFEGAGCIDASTLPGTGFGELSC